MNVTSIGVGTIALIRCTGEAQIAGETEPWSTILKVLEPDGTNKFGASNGPGNWGSGPGTEIEVYQSNTFAPTEGPFRGGRCYLVDEKEDGLYWLWMEDLSHLSGSDWTANQYSLAANSIGQFRGKWLEKDLTPLNWLARNSFLNELEAPGVLQAGQKNFLALKDSEYFRSGVPGNLYDRLIGLREHLPTFVKVGLTLPVTLAHSDCHIRNLFVSDDSAETPEVVAIDFARVGIEHLGLDGGELFVSSFMWTDPEAKVAMDNADRIYSSWLEGLRSSGWRGSEQAARFGYLIPSLRRAIMVPGMLAWVATGTAFPLERYGGSRDDMPKSIRNRVEFLLPLVDEAVALAKQIG
jgi:hypothetical protein